MTEIVAKHTPGPWEAQRSPRLHDGAYDFAISAPGFPIIAEAFGRTSDGRWPAVEANARLIAAAPDMLTALRTIALHVTSLDATGIRELADEAIAKAEGRAA